MTTAPARQSPHHQFALALPSAPARLSRRDFVVAPSNEHALAMLLQWRASVEPLLVIAGPTASGKTHLLHILAEDSGGAIAIVDGIASGVDPLSLLSMIERARETGARLAIAGKGDPADWAHGLRDLETRLAAAARIVLNEPDEALLRAVVLKLLGDRQLRASPGLAAYATARLPKTFAAAAAFVAAIDAASIASRLPIGLRLARAVIANLSEEPSAPY